MEKLTDDVYRIEVFNLEGELVYLSEDSSNQFCRNTLLGNLPVDAYTLKISSQYNCVFEKLIIE